MRFSNSFGYAIKRRDAIGRLVPKDNLALLVDPGAQMIDNSDANKPYRPLNLGAEQADNPDFHDFTIDYPSIGEPDPFYESDFSAGTDGWNIYGHCVLVGNQDGISDGLISYDDALKIYPNADNAVHRTGKDLVGIKNGQYAKIRFKFYLPSSNTNVDGIRFNGNGVVSNPYIEVLSISCKKVSDGTDFGTLVQVGDSYDIQNAKGAWAEVEIEIKREHNSDIDFSFMLLAGTTTTYTGTNDPNDDLLYIYDFVAQKVGLVAWWQFDSYYNAQEGGGGYIGEDWSGNGTEYSVNAWTNNSWNDSNSDGEADGVSPYATARPQYSIVDYGSYKTQKIIAVDSDSRTKFSLDGYTINDGDLIVVEIEYRGTKDISVYDEEKAIYVPVIIVDANNFVTARIAINAYGPNQIIINMHNGDAGDWVEVKNLSIKKVMSGYLLKRSTGFDWQNQLTGDDPTYKNGNALEFDGVNDYAYIPAAIAEPFNPGTGDFSIICWISSESLEYQGIFSKYNDTNRWTFYTRNGNITFYYYDGSGHTLGNTTLVCDGNQHLVVFVRSGDNWYIYVDGTQTDFGTGLSGVSFSNNSELQVGIYKNDFTAKYFNGYFPTAAYFNRALSATEVSALSGKPKYWTWNETGSISNNNFKAELSGGAELSQDITTDDETLYKEQKISTADNDVDYFGNTTSHTITLDDGIWSYAGVKDVTNVDAVGNNFVEDFSKDGAVYSGNKTLNGSFDVDSNWSKATGVTIEGGKAVFNNVSAGAALWQGAYDYPKFVMVQFEISDYSSGSVRIDYPRSPYYSGNGTYTFYGWMETQYLQFRATDETTLKIDNVILKEVSNGNHGIAQGGLETNQPVYPYAWEFDGVDDYVDFGSDFGNFGTSDFLIAFWIKKESPPTSYSPIMGKNYFGGTPSTNGYGFGLLKDGSGKASFQIRYGENNSVVMIYSSTNVCDNAWHYIVGVRKNDTIIELYVDCVLEATDEIPIPNQDLSSTYKFLIGSRDSEDAALGYYLSGKIAPVTIYPFDGQDGRASVMPSNYVDHYIQRIYNRTRKYFGV